MNQIETRQKAERLFISGLSLDEVGEQLKIPAGTLSKWSASGGWKSKREVEQKIASMMPKIKLKLLKDIEGSKDAQATAQLVNAFSGLQKATEGVPKKEKDSDRPENPDQKERSPEEALKLIKEMVTES